MEDVSKEEEGDTEMTIYLGVLKLKSKIHRVKQKGDEEIDEYILTFRDEWRNTLKVKGERIDFEEYDLEDILSTDRLKAQSKLTEE